MEDDLTDALLHQLVVGRPHQGVVPDTDQMLEDGEKVGLGRGVHHQIFNQLETFIDIVQLQSDVVEPLGELIKILFFVFMEDFELKLQFFSLVIFKGLQHINETVSHKLISQMDPENIILLFPSPRLAALEFNF